MSFMFNPHPYDDPYAINRVPTPDAVREGLVSGLSQVAKAIARAVEGGKRRVGLDMYPGAQAEVLVRMLQQQLPELSAVDTRSLALPKAALEALIAPCLPIDKTVDPVLLYGVRFEGEYEDLLDGEKLANVRGMVERAEVPILVYGPGALCGVLRDQYDLRIWLDITPKKAVLNFKNGLAVNFGADAALPFSLMMRRNYYVDFELGLALRWQLIRERAIDLYISGSEPEKMQMLPFPALEALFGELNRRPFRCRPVYLEGVWGGYHVKRLRRMPESVRNCAWVFDMIPMEVSLVADMDGTEFETPFYTFVQAMGEKLLGQRAFDAFGGYFPIRFNYDDTYHSAGNMSIQCHPDEKYVVENHGELGRQDESYYICVTGQDAKTYLGFADEAACDAFLAEAQRVRGTKETIDYARYVHAEASRPGMQVMIPAGTIHASGRNQVILEIGSLTVGSYTYKLYDYQRIDPATGLPRPIHLEMGREVLRPERTAQWVRENLVDHGGLVREGEGWREIIVGEHPLLYFSLRNLIFDQQIEDDTRGMFHVLALVDGERVRVESVADPSLFYALSSLDIVVVPAFFGAYRVINGGAGTVTVHKTLLKGDA